MQRVLEFVIRYLGFVYLDPSSKFVDSRTRGERFVNAWIAIETDKLKWVIHADRDQVRLNVGTRIEAVSKSTYSTSLVRQLLEGGPERDDLLDDLSVEWVRDNVDSISALFADEGAARKSCRALEELQMSNVVSRGWVSESRRA